MCNEGTSVIPAGTGESELSPWGALSGLMEPRCGPGKSWMYSFEVRSGLPLASPFISFVIFGQVIYFTKAQFLICRRAIMSP